MMDDKMIDKIIEFFETNYETMKLEGGHSLTEAGKQDALEQIIYYYRKLHSIAEKVTETEVKLSLPGQFTEKGRRFGIEGIVDIVKEDDEVWMYDIKTHDADFIKANSQLYEKQLDVYAHIWQQLRGNKLDHTAIISTNLPISLKSAIRENNADKIDREFNKWEPIIEIPITEKQVQETIDDFGRVVDCIEDHCFAAVSMEKIRTKIEGTNILFVTRVCRNCDARFSCDSFREYALTASGNSQSNFKKYLEDFGNDSDQEDWINGNLNLDKINFEIDKPE